MKKNILILNNIRSVYNVGAIFRTADALGINKIYLSGYTPAPLDRFGRIRKDFHKSALGAEKSVPWEQSENILNLIDQLKEEGYRIISIEQDQRSVDYKKVKLNNKNAFILGSEVEGLSESVLNKSDVISEIKMLGKKESLNVSVAAGIVLSRLLNM